MFVPIATFDEPRKSQNDEFVAIMEGAVFPFFGIAYSIEKVQYNFDLSIEESIDHSKTAVQLAQKIANLFVDEARLNGNFHSTRREEAESLISNYDSELIEKIYDDANGNKEMVELYLFEW